MTDVNASVDAVLKALEDNNPSAYEMAVSVAQDARETSDSARWVIGDLAGGIERAYGKDHITAFGKQVGGIKRSTIYEYARVASVFPPDERAEYAGMAWSLFRIAARIEEQSARVDFLERAASGLWTVDEAEREAALLKGKQAPPATLIDSVFTVVNVNAHTGVVTLKAFDGGADTLALQDAASGGRPVRVKIIELTTLDEVKA